MGANERRRNQGTERQTEEPDGRGSVAESPGDGYSGGRASVGPAGPGRGALRLGGNLSRALTVAVAVMLSLLVAACGGGGDSEDGGEGSGESDGGGGPQNVGVILKALDNPFFVAMEEGVRATAEDLGIEAQVQAAAQAEDTSGQASELDSLAAQDFPCYVANPISGTNLIQPLGSISQNDTPIVNIDSPVDQEAADQAGVNINTYIGSDNVEAGRIAGERMIELLDEGAPVALINGISGNVTGEDRLRGFEQAVEGQLEIVQRAPANFQRQRALTVATDVLRANPDLEGFFVANDQMALGVATAVRDAGRQDEVEIIGVDGIEPALQAVEEGRISATVAQYPWAMGRMGVQACVQAANGEELPDNVDAPIQLVNQDNVGQAQESFPRPFFEYENPFEGAGSGG